MILKDLIELSSLSVDIQGFEQIDIQGISNDSRRISSGYIYIAQKGIKFDGNEFIADVLQQGIKVIISENEVSSSDIPSDVCYIFISDLDQGIKRLLFSFYGSISSQVKTIGITGTNGKTTISYLIESVLGKEHSVSVIGTVNYRVGQKILPAVNTTPGLFENQKLMSEFADDGVEYCIMEVSSHALEQGRVEMIDFRTAVFTNLTNDHLDYHKTMENYFSAKAKLFIDLSDDAYAIINADDSFGRKLYSKTSASIMSYGIENKAEVCAEDIQMDLSGTQFKLVTPEGNIQIRTNLIGQYNIYNILAAAAACLVENISLEQIQKGIEQLNVVPGRLEKVECEQDFSVFIDYAHTQDALENVLTMLRQTSDARAIVVFGCGGDRDKAKRIEMGKIACQLADVSIVTTDNPRSEDPQVIIDEIIQGFNKSNYEVVLNRADAIVRALTIAEKGDIVLIAGKGHENYQIFKDSKIPFDEKSIIRDHFYANS